MIVTRHCIEIESTLEKTFNICADVKKWPEIFPPCLNVKILKQNESLQLIEITALADDKTLTWQSERKLDPDSYTIFSRQIKPSPIVKSMQCAWRFDAVRSGVLLSLEHQFEMKDNVQGLMENISSTQDAVDFMHRVIDNNTRRELGAIKHTLESTKAKHQNDMDFQKELIIDAPPQTVYDLLQNAEAWPALLPHCISTEIIYDDGRNQEFVMTVDVQGNAERIRTIRKCSANYLIQYFQPSPPPLLQRHVGEWKINPLNGSTQVIAWHSISLNLDNLKSIWGDLTVNEALNRVENAINRNSMSTMKSIQNHIKNLINR